jgi:CMP-N-acetylneuraminic acid synthetase
MLNAAIYITPANEDALSIPIQTVDRLYFMDQRSSIDIDTPLDWIMAEAAMENGH